MSTQDPDLSQAVEAGDLTSVKKMLDAGANPNTSDANGRTPLLFAAKKSNEQIARLLLERGANPNVSLKSQVGWDSDVGRTPLMYFANAGNDQLVQLLIEKGAEINARDASNRAAIDYAVENKSAAVVKTLLEKGARVDGTDDYGRTPLLNAVLRGSTEITRLLIESKAALNTVSSTATPVDDMDKNFWGLTPLMLAAQSRQTEIVKLLLDSGADVNARARDEQPAYGTSALAVAMRQGLTEIVRLLLDAGANVNSQDVRGMTPLIIASFYDQPDVIRLLVDHGADIDHKDKSQNTALMISADWNYAANVRVLLDKSANLNERDRLGRTPLLLAAAGEGGAKSTATIELLLAKGADTSVFDNKDRTALMIAAQEGNEEAVKLLLDKGADINAQNKKGTTALMFAAAATASTFNYLVETLIARGAKIDIQDGQGNTALMIAAWFGRETTARVLLSKGASLRIKNKQGENALLLAARAGEENERDFGVGSEVSFAPESEFVRLVSHLLDHGADVNAQDVRGKTALMLALQNNKFELGQLLIRRRALLRIKDSSGKTARQLAEQDSNAQAIALLTGAEGAETRRSRNPRTPQSDRLSSQPSARATAKPPGLVEPSEAFWKQFTVSFENDRPQAFWYISNSRQGKMMGDLFRDLVAAGFGQPDKPRELKGFWEQLDKDRAERLKRKYSTLFASEQNITVSAEVAKLFGADVPAMLGTGVELDEETIAMFDEQVSEMAPRLFMQLKELGIGMDADTVNRQFGDFLKGPKVRSLRTLIKDGRLTEAWNEIETARSAPFRVLQQQRPVIVSSEPKKLREELSRVNLEIIAAQQDVIRLANEYRAAGGNLKEVFPENDDENSNGEPEIESRPVTREARQLRAAGERIKDLLFRRAGLLAELVDYWEEEKAAVSAPEAAKLLPEGTISVVFAYESSPLAMSSTSTDKVHVFVLKSGAKVGDESDLNLSPPILNRTIEISTTELSNEMNKFRALITHSDTAVENVAAQGRKLFDKIFPGELGQAVKEARQVLISPDGPLWDMPFAALVINTSGAPAYLGLEKPLSYTDSLTQFAYVQALPQRVARESKPFALVLGAPNFNRPAWRSADAFLVRGYLDPLPATREEAQCIAGLYGAQPSATGKTSDGVLLLGNDATEEQLRRWIEKADIIHLATHGYIETARQLTMDSGVWLTPSANRPTTAYSTNDGALQAAEVFNQLKLHAELVVISACEMGRGRDLRGAGVADMIWALHAAGAKSVVASQWEVADKSTSTLMIAFHELICEGLAKNEALRRAMLKVQGDTRTAHPYFWAPFVLSGDSQTTLPAGRTGCSCSAR